MEQSKISQKEYLKKYLSSNDDRKKKKKKKLKVGSKTVKIIDDDIDYKKLKPIEDDDEFEIFNNTEDAPQIVGVIDERAPDKIFADKKRWKIIADDGEGDIAVSKQEDKVDGMESRDTGENRLKSKKYKKSSKNEENDLLEQSPDRQRLCKTDFDLHSKSLKRENKKEKHRTISDSFDSDTDSKSAKKPTNKRNGEKRRRKPNSSESDVDLSPPRKSKLNGKDNKNESQKSDSESDLSPPRKSKSRGKNYKQSRKQSNFDESDSDLSLPRHSGNKNYRSRRKISDDELGLSPPRKLRLDNNNDRKRRKKSISDTDLSPPRKSRVDNKDDKKQRKKSTKSDSDLTPPRKLSSNNIDSRKQRKKPFESDSDLSPPRRSRPEGKINKQIQRKCDSDSDLSPPRRSRPEGKINKQIQRKCDSDSDLSPPRKAKHSRSNDQNNSRRYENSSRDKYCKSSSKTDRDSTYRKSNDRKQSRYDSKDKSSSRRSNVKEDSDGDLTPPRRSRQKLELSPRRSKVSRWDSEYRKSHSPEGAKSENKRMKKTLDGKTAGLQDAKALKEETESHRNRETDMFNEMSAEASGIGQATIVRDRKTGKKRDLAAEAAEEREKNKEREELEEKYAQWGKGLKQVEDQTERLKRDLHEMSKPVARYADDADLDRELREQLHDEDPMLEYMKKKMKKEGKLKPERPTYEGTYMPNRFGIKPGYRWDGVDRSNGYEKEWFESRNARKAVEEEAYKWSTSDM